MITHCNTRVGPYKTKELREVRGWSAFNLPWLAFLFSAMPLVYLVLVRGPMLAIYQDFGINLPFFTSVALHWSTLVCLSLLPIAVLAKEFASFNASQAKLVDYSAVFLARVLGLISCWALFRPLTTYVQGLDV